ncbi:hypothetical protein J1614_006571 [Plenodomus biglobosus]|nr:hypothetical protein J1614_006571 [Plenodomus biglobosus]
MGMPMWVIQAWSPVSMPAQSSWGNRHVIIGLQKPRLLSLKLRPEESQEIQRLNCGGGYDKVLLRDVVVVVFEVDRVLGWLKLQCETPWQFDETR